MTMFDDVMRHVDAVIDDIYGEQFSYQPRRETFGGETVVDTDRDAVPSVLGVYSDAGQHQKTEGASAEPMAGFVTSPARFSYVSSQIPSPVQRLDRFIRLRDSAVYEVTAALPDGINRTSVELVTLP